LIETILTYRDRDLRLALDDVVVGHDIAVRRDDETGAETARRGDHDDGPRRAFHVVLHRLLFTLDGRVEVLGGLRVPRLGLVRRRLFRLAGDDLLLGHREDRVAHVDEDHVAGLLDDLAPHLAA